MGMRVQDDAVYVVMTNFTNEGRRARVLKLDLKTGTEQWTTAAMEGAHPIDLRLGKGAMAVLANMYKVKKVGQRVQHHMADPTLFCIDKETGRIVQRVVLKRTDRPVGRNFARRIIPADETLWVVYNDRLVGYRGPD